MRLFLAGDVMTGRGIDQILEHPGDPTLHEQWAQSAMEYVQLAERRRGTIPVPAGPSYIWGDALTAIADADVDARIINLETAVTGNDEPWPDKGIHYRMHPRNMSCLTVAGIDCCVLANNHVLDWSHAGLEETLTTLREAGLLISGAGPDEETAHDPAVIETPSGARVLVFGLGSTSSGIPRVWEAHPNRAGVALAEPLSSETVDRLAKQVAQTADSNDVVVVSIHWGSNWGYRIPAGHRRFAHELIDRARVDIIHGHSSHHPLAMEVYRDRPIFYGCGDLINDYEGIGGHEEYHPNLRVLYLVNLAPDTGKLEAVDLVPMVSERFSLRHAPAAESEWLCRALTRQGEAFGTSVVVSADHRLGLRW